MEAVKYPVGFIGLGVMGSSLARHVMDAGYPLHVFTRKKEKADALLADGAVWHDSPASLARGCHVVFTMVGYPSDVRQVYLDMGSGLIGAATPGTILVDMTTSRPDLAIELYEKGRAAGLKVLDAPVSGGDLGARNGTLSIMAGGDEDAFLAVKPLFALMGKTIHRQGGAGAGQHAKMANQIAIAGSLVGVVESMLYSKAVGMDPSMVIASIGSGAAGSWQLLNMAPRMLSGNFAPGFFAKHYLKDLRIALDSARDMNLKLPMLELVEGFFAKIDAEGLGEAGTQILYSLYEKGLI